MWFSPNNPTISDKKIINKEAWKLGGSINNWKKFTQTSISWWPIYSTHKCSCPKKMLPLKGHTSIRNSTTSLRVKIQNNSQAPPKRQTTICRFFFNFWFIHFRYNVSLNIKRISFNKDECMNNQLIRPNFLNISFVRPERVIFIY